MSKSEAVTTQNVYTDNQFNTVLAIIREAQTVDLKASKVSVKLMAIAGEFGLNHDAFAITIKDAATQWKAKAKKTALPTTFTQCKSNIIAAMKLGINPSEYPSESSMRTALNAERKARKDVAIAGSVNGMTKEFGKVKTSTVGTAALVTLAHTLSTLDPDIADALAIALANNADALLESLEQVKAESVTA